MRCRILAIIESRGCWAERAGDTRATEGETCEIICFDYVLCRVCTRTMSLVVY